MFGTYFLLCLVFVLCGRIQARDTLISKLDANVSTLYTGSATRFNIHVYDYNLLEGANVRIQTNISSANVSSPLLITTFHKDTTLTRSLPLVRELFPGLSELRNSEVTCPDKLNETSNLNVRIQTYSIEPIPFSVTVINSPQSQSFLEINQMISTLIDPSFSVHYQMDIPLNVEILEIHLTSPSDLCCLVRITNVTCPPDFSVRSSLATPSYEFTMSQVADISVRRSSFKEGKLMILISAQPAATCSGTVEYSEDILSENFQKNISLVVNEGSAEFWVPLILMTLIFLIPYLMVLILAIFELTIIHCFPRLSKGFSMFSRIRQTKLVGSEEKSNSGNGEDKNEEIELKTAEKQQEIEETHEPEKDIADVYKAQAKAEEISICVEGKYYYDLINSKEITVEDISVIPIKHLQRKNNLYIYFVLLTGLFYIVPAIQISYLNYQQFAITGIQDVCSFNYKCDGRSNDMIGFNNIFSNIGYILLAILFLCITIMKHISVVREIRADGLPTTGTPRTFGLYYSLSLALFFEGILSGIYHICPTLTSLQFDTTFIYGLLILICVKYYQLRHPDANISPFSVFMLLYIAVLYTSASLLSGDLLASRISLTILFLLFACFLVISLWAYFVPQILYYYPKEWAKHKSVLRALRQICWPPYNKLRAFHIVHIPLAIMAPLIIIWVPGIVTEVYSTLIFFIGLTLVVYIIFFWVMKLLCKDFLHRPFVFFITVIMLLLSFVGWASAVYFWSRSPISPSKSPSSGRSLNEDCVMFDYFDYHDIWHMLSAIGSFFLFLATIMADENMALVPRNQIRAF